MSPSLLGTRLHYAKNGHLWLSRSERWQLDPDNQPVNCEPLAAMECRYTSGRARYLVRPRDPVTMLPYGSAEGRWSDYDGDSIYGDYMISPGGPPPNIADTMAHEPGLARLNHANGSLHHLHGNLIGTTERMTDDVGNPDHRAVYTAFGEPVYTDGAISTRYGYVGAWGYGAAETPDPLADLGWLHVGERYYDPSVGRFMQRDPIGIRGGLNVYEYAQCQPTMAVDPSGLTAPLAGDWAGVEFVDDVFDLTGGAGTALGASGAGAEWVGVSIPVAARTCLYYPVVAAGWKLGRSAGDFAVKWTPVEECAAEAIIGRQTAGSVFWQLTGIGQLTTEAGRLILILSD